MANWLGQLIRFITPSMFGVFILHETCLRNLQYTKAAMPCVIVHAFVLFSLCLAIDILRRLIVDSVKAIINTRLKGGVSWRKKNSF